MIKNSILICNHNILDQKEFEDKGIIFKGVGSKGVGSIFNDQICLLSNAMQY